MSEDDIYQSTKSVLQGLDRLKNEYENMINSSDKTPDNLRKSLNMIEIGINEAQIIIQLDYYLQNFEAEKQKLSSQIKHLSQENSWLRDELGLIQRKVHDSEQMNTSYSAEIEHLKFVIDTKSEDNETSTNQSILEIDSNKFESYIDLFTFPSQSTNDYQIPIRLKTLHNLVLQYASEGQYEVAISLCRQTLEDLERTLGHQHPDVATMMNILALVYREQSNYKEASVLLHDALSIREKIFGLSHSVVASTLNNLAILYSKRNKFKEAESLCRRALDIREKTLGLIHPDVAKQLNNLALLCQNQEKYDEVEFYYKQAIDIYIKTLGFNDSNVIKIKNNLASIYFKQEKYIEAEQLYKDILNYIFDNNSLNLSIIPIIKNLSILYRRQDRYDLADTLENYALHSQNDLQIIHQILDIIK